MDALPTPTWIPRGQADRWREDLLAWLTHALAGHGLRATGPATAHKLAPWSIVLELPTTSGPVWFKENVPTLAPEPALLGLLSELVPGRVPVPLATDPARGWLLLPDHGTTLRARGNDDDPLLWVQLVSEWSQTTRELAAHTGALEAIGVPGLDPQAGGGYLGRRIEVLASLPDADPRRLAPVDADRLTAALPVVADAGEQLAALGLPNTLWHNDLHTNNVFEPRAAGLVFFDLGDALIGSPLGDLLIPLRFHAHARGSELAIGDDVFDDPDLARIVEAAIEPWTDLASTPDLRAAVPAALQMGAIGRSESWRRAVHGHGHGQAVEDQDAAASTAWLLELVGGADGSTH